MVSSILGARLLERTASSHMVSFHPVRCLVRRSQAIPESVFPIGDVLHVGSRSFPHDVGDGRDCRHERIGPARGRR